MASSAVRLSLFLLLTLLSSLYTHARDSQFFSKIPSTTNNVVVPNNKEEAANNQQEQQEPDFLPENENSYGLYGHETGQNPPSTAATDNADFKQPDQKYLPKNYNPVAYVTQPENVNENTAFTEERSFTTNPDNNNNYYNSNNQQQGVGLEEAEFRSYTTTPNNRDNYYNGGESFNSQPQGETNRDNYFNYGGANRVQPQGMSDTRFVANGKYHYDINAGRYSSNHPYETLRAQNEFSTRNFNGNNVKEFDNRNFYTNNANDFNAEGYQNSEEFQNEENLP